MLNTMSSAHKEILGAKFLSFEHPTLKPSHTVGYTITQHKIRQTKTKNRILYVIKMPL